jgi:S-disulfanyl-L-cysteine oxidoreductase SoxD
MLQGVLRMFMPKTLNWLVLVCGVMATPALYSQNLGQPVQESQLIEFDLVAAPDGSGLPAGSGTAIQGKAVFDSKCAACHTLTGEGVSGATRLVGGDMQSEGNPLKTVGSFWPHATTLFDFIRRAMPANAPKSLSNLEVYQTTAYVLFLNGIIPEDMAIDKNSLLEVVMPNADGFIDRSDIQ